MPGSPPLAVDLDGTLVLTDTLHESALKLIKSEPLCLLRIPCWLLRGRAHAKRQIGARVLPDVSLLPYNEPLIEWLEKERADGRQLCLCTASDERLAQAVSRHTGLFGSVVASNGLENMKGEAKRAALEARYGKNGFSYAGDAAADLRVWEGASSTIVASGNQGLEDRARQLCDVEKSFPRTSNAAGDLLRLLRTHQWAKNALLFVPALAGHRVDVSTLVTLSIAFLAFSLSSSLVYIVNDLLDVESDRRHPRKRLRPFASGSVSIVAGIALAAILMPVSGLVAWQVGESFTMVLVIYLLLTMTYSLLLKRIVLIDCLTLAGLYTVRVIAGAAAISIAVSYWLLAFSVFLFLSLAFLKRYVEIREVADADGRGELHGRGYRSSDLDFVQGLGLAAGMISVLVFALYIESPAIQEMYRAPEFVWAALVVFLYWVSRTWLKAHRGEMHDDPVVFAVTDRGSLACGACFLAAIALGTVGLPA